MKIFSFIIIRAAPNSRLFVSRPEEAWSTKILLVAEKNYNKIHIGEVMQSVTDRSLMAGLCGNSTSFIDLKYDLSSEICKY